MPSSKRITTWQVPGSGRRNMDPIDRMERARKQSHRDGQAAWTVLNIGVP